MAKREQARAEAAFARGDVGVDGAATEETKDVAEVERGQAREQLLRGRAYLGRELLTWMLWRSETGDALVELEGTGVNVLFMGRITLRGVAGDVTELSAKGTLAPYSEQVKHALDKGLLVAQARIRFTHGEKEYEATLDSEFLDVRAAKLPALMSEEEDDQLNERLFLTEQLSAMIDALVGDFLKIRVGKTWSKQVVPAMKEWMRGDEQGANALSKAARARGRDARAARH
ncbi:hypothetical protein HUA74_43020 [Myxococcus sp. CA051A]|uniref:Uncharacterized protein n=1 Tax=Myxococcus llanfairpwllgwyngyllgogerychwyrndrobwllllantysiliogogogochensis TaxID=2590453 RepID=A0A540WQV4_9BACT|nr:MULTISPECIES: hypothetical protein [Myxococcus]NTX08390.1 hypothetical protein [Myxococcus sp. CA040A]NTX14654.1 hypothetical protein [Myxococcus sp. CA056]NTX40444.1 hypothetical protein [Myxococcus sp. CA033]NTX55298.1 hypothetical protein [Myxococcus sp. CA039A]NTX67443.1 hypothetical protein [Myxococcus sp. CA051A]